jgi:shikimate kinase
VDNLVLTGFMGTGKTSVGRALADKLDMEFVDTDELIESRHGPIEQIFTERGEDAFRQIESQVARDLGARKGVVIATGGRMLLDAANAAELTQHGVVFCLVASPEEVHRRITSEEIRRERPLLEVEDPKQRIAELMKERQAGYRQFRQIQTDRRDIDAIAGEIFELWSESRLDS